MEGGKVRRGEPGGKGKTRKTASGVHLLLEHILEHDSIATAVAMHTGRIPCVACLYGHKITANNEGSENKRKERIEEGGMGKTEREGGREVRRLERVGEWREREGIGQKWRQGGDREGIKGKGRGGTTTLRQVY